MTLTHKTGIAFLILGALLAGWQFQLHRQQGRDLAILQAQVRNKQEELNAGRPALADLERKNSELVEAERRAGNQTLITLMRERSAVTRAGADAAEAGALGGVLANVLENPGQQAVDEEAMRDQMRAHLKVFFDLTHLTPEKIEEYINVQIEMERRKSARMSALYRGRMPVADALKARDQDNRESVERLHAVLGPEGTAFQDSIADGMRNDEAKNTVKVIQENMGVNPLNQEQSDRLQGIIKAQLADLSMDDTDLFRTPDDWEQFVGGHQQNILKQASAFLTPAQMETLRMLAAVDLAQKKEEMIRRRKSVGIK
jgi:hypothetical protein